MTAHQASEVIVLLWAILIELGSIAITIVIIATRRP